MVEQFGGSRHDDIDWDKEALALSNETERRERKDKENEQIKEEVTDLRFRNEDLAQQARTDVLTGLSNRRGFTERAEDVFRGIHEHREVDGVVLKRAALIACDIDHFKKINDTYGHDAGDKVLQALGTLLADSFRADDMVRRVGVAARLGGVARTGGEEFVALMVDASAGDAARKAEGLRTKFEALPFSFGGEELHFTMSIGVATTEDGPDLLSVMKKADNALYAAKNGGRNRIALSEGMRKAA